MPVSSTTALRALGAFRLLSLISDTQELAEGRGRELTVLREMRDREHPRLG